MAGHSSRDTISGRFPFVFTVIPCITVLRSSSWRSVESGSRLLATVRRWPKGGVHVSLEGFGRSRVDRRQRVITFQLSGEVLGRTRFAFSPLSEVTLSLRLL